MLDGKRGQTRNGGDLTRVKITREQITAEIGQGQINFTLPKRHCRIVIAQERPGLLCKSVPRVSGMHTRRSPFQNSSAEIVLEQLHLTGECWLGNVQALGGTALGQPERIGRPFRQ